MIISLVRLPKDGLKFNHQYIDGELDLSDREFTLAVPVTVNGDLARSAVEVRLRCTLQTSILCPCDRCLKDVRLPIDLSLDLIYLPVGMDNQRSGEIELIGRDLDSSVYENEQIDLDAMVIEQLELSVPFRLVCSEECRGLCHQCGNDMNYGACDCQAPLDPRWEALAQLRGKLEKK